MSLFLLLSADGNSQPLRAQAAGDDVTSRTHGTGRHHFLVKTAGGQPDPTLLPAANRSRRGNTATPLARDSQGGQPRGHPLPTKRALLQPGADQWTDAGFHRLITIQRYRHVNLSPARPHVRKDQV